MASEAVQGRAQLHCQLESVGDRAAWWGPESIEPEHVYEFCPQGSCAYIWHSKMKILQTRFSCQLYPSRSRQKAGLCLEPLLWLWDIAPSQSITNSMAQLCCQQVGVGLSSTWSCFWGCAFYPQVRTYQDRSDTSDKRHWTSLLQRSIFLKCCSFI